MYDKSKIIPGLLIFLVLATFPVWYNVASGKVSYLPKPKAPADKKECVESKEYIRVHHKDLLEDWKQSVVREGRRTYEATNKKTYVMSLNRTCMSCHRDKAEFCDQCHNYVGVTNKCWDCHLFPKQEIKG
jgi:[DsrC]-trisulfide reductase subunit J